MYRLCFFVLFGMILVAAVSWLIVHQPSVAYLGVMTVFGGACFVKGWPSPFRNRGIQ